MASQTILSWIFLFASAYLLGSIPFGLVLARMFLSVDLRHIGSGNIGATNAKRAGGWVLGIATLILDIAKGALPVGLAVWLAGTKGGIAELAIVLTAVTAVLGHLYPIYLGFKTGGKGVATAAGCFMILSPLALTMAVGIFLATVAGSRRISASSLAAAVSLPVAVYFTGNGPILSAGTLVISLLIIGRHRDNIGRLLKGTEPTLSQKTVKSDKTHRN